MLLEELRLFDNKIYGVAHGLLMAHNENTWSQALQLFDEVKRMDSSTASAFYNALTDMLWYLGQVIIDQVILSPSQSARIQGSRRRADELLQVIMIERDLTAFQQNKYTCLC